MTLTILILAWIIAAVAFVAYGGFLLGVVSTRRKIDCPFPKGTCEVCYPKVQTTKCHWYYANGSRVTVYEP